MKEYLVLSAAFTAIFSFSVIHQSGSLSLSVQSAQAKQEAKVTICHYPPGNPSNYHTMEVAQPAVSAHLAHGDTLGACAPPACVCPPGMASCVCADGTPGSPGVSISPPSSQRSIYGGS